MSPPISNTRSACLERGRTPDAIASRDGIYTITVLWKAALVAKVVQYGGDAAKANRAIEKLHKAEEIVHHVAEENEHVKVVREAMEKTMAKHEQTETRNETQERGEFQIEILHSLSDLDAQGMKARFDGEDVITGMLRMLESSNMDLMKLVKDTLGELPTADGLEGVAQQVADHFEVELYVKYYVESGRATRVITKRRGHEVADEIGGIPEAVQARIRKVGRGTVLDSLKADVIEEDTWTGRMQ